MFSISKGYGIIRRCRSPRGMGYKIGVEVPCTHLSHPVSMLTDTGSFPFGVTGMGICDANEGVLSCLGIQLVAPIKRVSLKWPESSFGGDMAVRIADFGPVVGFITKPTPPSVPSLVDRVYPVAEGVHRASAIVALQDGVKEVDVEGVWR